jgi:hypothetical protein
MCACCLQWCDVIYGKLVRKWTPEWPAMITRTAALRASSLQCLGRIYSANWQESERSRGMPLDHTHGNALQTEYRREFQ